MREAPARARSPKTATPPGASRHGVIPIPSDRDSADISAVEGERFVFIVGASRSGTTWCQTLLGHHPMVSSSSELQLFAQYVTPWIRSWEAHVADPMPAGLPLVFSEEEFREKLRSLVTAAYRRVLRAKPGAEVILEKMPQYTGGVDVLESFIPSARFIHVIRDGRDVATSLMAASRGWGREWAPRTTAAAARWWRSGLEAALETSRFEGRYLEVRYEELVRDTRGRLRAMLRFLGLPHDAPLIDDLVDRGRFERMRKRKLLDKHTLPDGFVRRGQVGAWKEDLTPLQQYAFDRAAGPLLRSLGYAEDTWWASRPWHHTTVPVHHALVQPGIRAKLRALRALTSGLGARGGSPHDERAVDR